MERLSGLKDRKDRKYTCISASIKFWSWTLANGRVTPWSVSSNKRWLVFPLDFFISSHGCVSCESAEEVKSLGITKNPLYTFHVFQIQRTKTAGLEDNAEVHVSVKDSTQREHSHYQVPPCLESGICTDRHPATWEAPKKRPVAYAGAPISGFHWYLLNSVRYICPILTMIFSTSGVIRGVGKTTRDEAVRFWTPTLEQCFEWNLGSIDTGGKREIKRKRKEKKLSRTREKDTYLWGVFS